MPNVSKHRLYRSDSDSSDEMQQSKGVAVRIKAPDVWHLQYPLCCALGSPEQIRTPEQK